MTPCVFLITGTSTGCGADYVNHVLASGGYVVATARDPSSLNIDGATDVNLLKARLDVTDKESVGRVFHEAKKKFGRVDVAVNNADYGLAGRFEEYSEEMVRRQMEVNFWGLLDVTRVALERMREQSPPGGVIQQITSIGGQRGGQLKASLKRSHELKPEWNIHLNLVEPGGFRTDWAGRSMTFTDRKLREYSHLDAKDTMSKRHGTQRGDPKKAAVAMYKFICMGKDTPLRVAVGNDSYDGVMNKLKHYGEIYPKYKAWIRSTDINGCEG